MNCLKRFTHLPLLGLAAALAIAGCHKNQDQTAANGQDTSSDPAAANLAPVSDNSTTAAPAPSSAAQNAPPPQSSGGASGESNPPSDQYSDESDYGEQPVATAPQPPPPLPQYDQPPAPGDDYIWTPGYWSYAPTGYYWVPGVWVQAPYQGALWTPGYWGYRQNRYVFFHGYWGPHIGFYGGVNYGFGYIGVGYQGGYWHDKRFYYNRAVNNVNTTVVHNVYDYRITNVSVNRVSYNGGSGGLQVRPRPAELAALREPHAPPMAAQLQIQHAASTNRAQFVAVNKGRPSDPVIRQPVQADRNVRPVAPVQMRNQPAPQQQPGAARPNAVEPARPAAAQPQQAQRPSQQHTEPFHPTPGRPVPQQGTAEHPAPSHTAPVQPTPNRPVPGHAQPAPAHAQPQRAPEARPAPQRAPARPAPRQETQPRPAPSKPESRPETKPAPHPAPHPAPEQRPDEKDKPKP